jgi:hypothetical protein
VIRAAGIRTSWSLAAGLARAARGRSCGGGADFASLAWLALIRCGDGAAC